MLQIPSQRSLLWRFIYSLWVSCDYTRAHRSSSEFHQYSWIQLGFRIIHYLHDWINGQLTEGGWYCWRSFIVLERVFGVYPKLRQVWLYTFAVFDFIGTHYQLPYSTVTLAADHMFSIQKNDGSFLTNVTYTVRQFQSLIWLSQFSLPVGGTNRSDVHYTDSGATS